MKSSGPWKASLRTKLVEVMEFQWSCFKSWKMMLWKCCTQYASKLESSAVATGLEKVSFHSNPKERQCKDCSNYCTIALISMVVKLCLKFSKPGFSNTWTVNFQMFKLLLGKAEELEIKLPISTFELKLNICWVPEKHLFLFYWLCQSLWLCGSQ